MATLKTLKVFISVLVNRTGDRHRGLPSIWYESSIHNPPSRHSSIPNVWSKLVVNEQAGTLSNKIPVPARNRLAPDACQLSIASKIPNVTE